MDSYVALLRGVNVGGKNKLPMKRLAAMFGEVGCYDVQTFIQSGNVVFRCSSALAKELCPKIELAIESELGFRPPLTLRSRFELQTVVSGNPYLAEGMSEDSLFVLFLADQPTQEALALLDPDRGKPDRYVVIGREIYLCVPGSVADTKLTNSYFDSKLKTVCTARNWRTTVKLLELMKE